MEPEKASGAVFGVFDGMVSVIGVMLGLATASSHIILAGALGLAAASSASMAAGEYLGDAKRSLRLACVMGVATALGTMVPIIPFLITSNKLLAFSGAALLTCLTASWIAERRAQFEPRMRAYVETYVILVLALGVTLAVTWATGFSG